MAKYHKYYQNSFYCIDPMISILITTETTPRN